MPIQVPVVFRGDADDLVDDLDRSLRGRTQRLFGEFGREAADRFSLHFNRETERFSTRFRSGFTGAFTAALQGAVIRDPRVLALFAASVVALMPAIGSLAAGSFVGAFGTGLAGLGLVFAAMNKDIKKEFKQLGKDLKKEMKAISEPFQDTLLVVADTIRETFDVFAPELAKAFQKMAPVLSRFVKQLGEAFEQLAPAIVPIARAFNAILREAGPRLVGFFKELADAIINVAKTIRQDPSVFVDIAGNILQIIPALLNFIAFLSRVQDKAEVFFAALRDSAVGDTFRRVIGNIVDALKDFFNIIKESGEVGKTFEAIKKFVEPLLPVFQKTAETVGGVLADGLRDIATLITTDLLPAFQQFLPAIQPIVKFLLEVFGTAVVEAVKGAVQAIKGFIKLLSGIMNLVADILQGNWSEIWDDLKQIAVGGFNAIVGVIRVFLSVTIIGFFRRFLVFLTKGIWKPLFKGLFNITRVGLTAVIRFFSLTLKGILAIVRGTFRAVVGFFRGTFNNIRTITVAGWKALRSAFGGALSAIRTVVSTTFQVIRSSIANTWNNIKTTTVSTWNAIRDAVKTGVDKAIQFVKDLPSKMASIIRGGAGALAAAGAALIQGLADSVADKIESVINAVKEGLNKIKSLLPGSPIREGPLVEWNSGKPGKDLMRLLAGGIADGAADLERAMANAVGTLNRVPIVQPMPRQVAQPAGQTKVEVNQNYFGPMTSMGRVREIEWALRYATPARHHHVRGQR